MLFIKPRAVFDYFRTTISVILSGNGDTPSFEWHFIQKSLAAPSSFSVVQKASFHCRALAL